MKIKDFAFLFNRNAACFLFIISEVYKDLLAITSTSEFVFIKLAFTESAIKESFYDFLLNHLEFVKTTDESAQADVDMDVNVQK